MNVQVNWPCMTVLFLVDKTCLYAPCGCYGDLSTYNTTGTFIFQT